MIFFFWFYMDKKVSRYEIVSYSFELRQEIAYNL